MRWNNFTRLFVIAAALLATPAPAQMPMLPLVPLPCMPPGFVPEPCDPPVPIVRLRMRVPACARPGEDLRYKISVDNCSPAPAYHVIVRNMLPANCKLVRADPEPEREGRDLVWKLGTLCGGCCREIVLVLEPQNAEDVKNCARVQFEHGQCVTTHIADAPGTQPPGMPRPGDEPPVRPVPADPKKDFPIPPPPPPQLPPPPLPKRAAMTLRLGGPKQQNVEQLTQYTITVTNTGTGDAKDLLVTAELPRQLKFESASDDGRYLQGQAAWLLPTLEAGQSRTVTLQVRAKLAGEHCIVAEGLANDSITGKELPKARDVLCTIFQGDCGLHIEMVDRSDPVEVGGSTSYPIQVINTGQIPATNLRIRAVIPAGMMFARATGPSNFRERYDNNVQVIEFEPLPALAAGTEITYEVFITARREGDWRFRVEMTADQLPTGPVVEHESTTIFREDPAPVRLGGEL